MQVKLYRIAGILFLFASLAPNLNWLIYIPILAVFSIFGIALAGIKRAQIITLLSFFSLLAMLSLLFPTSAKYNFLFGLVALSSLSFVELSQKRDFIEFVLHCGSYFLLFAVVIEALLPIGQFLWSRPEFDQHTLGFLRQRGLFSEPANLGYWAAWLGYLCHVLKLNRPLFLYVFLLFLSASTGAFLFFALLLLLEARKINFRLLSILSVFAFLTVTYVWEQILLKLSWEQSISLRDRIENLVFTLDYIQSRFPYPSGFGPIERWGVEIGILSFVLLLIKAFGALIVVFAPLLLRLFRRPITLIPVLFIFGAIGNFWETPLLVVLFYFAFEKYNCALRMRPNNSRSRLTSATDLTRYPEGFFKTSTHPVRIKRDWMGREIR